MEPTTETLMRAVLHDLANVLAGVQGILELSDPIQPLSSRDRKRLNAVLADGMSILERSRHLAMDTLPASTDESGSEFRQQCEARIAPLAIMFKTQIQFRHEGDPTWDHWRGEVLRSYLVALTRQILPYAHGHCLDITFVAEATHWRIRWSPASCIPKSLLSDQEPRSRDTASRWAIHLGKALGAVIKVEGDHLWAHIPRASQQDGDLLHD